MQSTGAARAPPEESAMSSFRIPVLVLISITAAGASACGSEPKSITTTSAGADTPRPTASAAVKPATTVTAVAVAVSDRYEDGESAYREGRYDDAAAIFTAYTSRRPDNAFGHYMLGLSSWKAGSLVDAVQSFDRALEIDSTHVKSLLNSSRVYLELNEPAQALARIQRAVAIDSTSSEAYRLLGRAFQVKGDADSAIDAYRHALALDERDVWAMNNLGLLYIDLARAEEAIGPLARAVELRGNAPVFRNNLGIALEGTGRYALAQEAYEGVLAVDSTYGKAAVSLDRVRPLVQESDSARLDLGQAAAEFAMQIRAWKQE
jgi:tetratricopeptide (TPR) repeat protein